MILAAALLAISQPPSQEAAGADVLGVGNQSCGAWNDAKREDGIGRVSFDSWLGGFFSGMNLGGGETYVNLTEGMDFKGLEGWMDNYCAASPLEPVSSAAAQLAIELLRRRSRPAH